MSPDTKARISYVILGTVYFGGGIEHGVSIPQGWIQWRERVVQAPDHVVGLAVAAYSVATFFVAPFMGRWVDKPGRSRSLLICGVCLHITGAMLEIFLTQQWVQILARFISGIGGGVDAVVLSEASRYTRPSHRTSMLALLVGARLFGCVLVPGLDAVLWRGVMTNVQLPERKTAALGLFLAVLWAVILVSLIFLYTELCRLKPSSYPSTASTLSSPTRQSYYSNVHITGTAPSNLGDDYEVVDNEASFSSSRSISIPPSLTNSQCSEPDTRHLARSSEMIEEAEFYIQRMAEQSATSVGFSAMAIAPSPSTKNCEDVIVTESNDDHINHMSTSFNHDHQTRTRAGSDHAGGNQGDLCTPVMCLPDTFDQNSYVVRSGRLPRRLQGQESVLETLYEEFIQQDSIAVLAICMSASFAHLCFQMLIVPVTKRFVMDQNLYMFVLFTLFLVLLLSVCAVLWWFSPQHRTLHVLVFGSFIVITSVAVFMVLLPRIDTDTEGTEEKVIEISVSVCLYVLGLPLVLVSAYSLFTLLTDCHHHGLRQGVFHSAMSVSAILAPLWLEGTLSRLYLHHAVIIGLLLISLVLVGCSYNSLLAQVPAVIRGRQSRHAPSTVRRPTTISCPSEQQRLLS